MNEDRKRIEKIRREVGFASPGVLSDFELLLAHIDKLEAALRFYADGQDDWGGRMKKFKTGNRVRVYATLNGEPAETSGTVCGIRKDGMLFVNLEIKTARRIVAHPKQVRRLVRK